MKKYLSLLTICSLMSFGFVFGAPEDHDESFQTFNEVGVTNANIAANGVVNVSALAPDGKLLIGGDFTLYKGITVNRFARINGDGTLDATFNPIVAPLTATTIGATGGAINSIAFAPGGTAENYSFFIGGSFTKYNNIDRNRLAKINCTTTGSTQTCALDPDFNKVIAPTTAANTGAKNVIVDGGNIQINSNIEYTGTGKTLLLIARKNSAGQGGNIYINPTVTRIDAIIIADGGTLINGTTTSGVTTTKNWITHPSDLTNRLTINGRLYSYNTRGGSITPQASGTDFDPIT